jgi:uncharacterized protein HemX
MKSLPIKPHHIAIIGVLIAFLALTALSFPPNSTFAVATSIPTPTVTPDPRINADVLESGNTNSLMVGAAVILAIVLGGVLILRLSTRMESKT